ncbi:MAG: helix-turn-helix transcriptional regulator [Desulfurivibrionaceae bacterium]|nr:helix-turn-helix transcriptional regulator [Desulfobulbales bacterium]MDT8334905.1 helix-turn-helix transcriptional regulator [Desulfurivibrionaceae bacterium]
MLSPEMRARLEQIGVNLRIARKKRNISLNQAAEKIGASLSSVRRMEQGDPAVRIETYLAALEVYQLDRTLRFAEPEDDRIGLALEKQRLPQRIRTKKEKRLDF